MPRKARIDAPGAVHHIMARGIEGGVIFQDRQDRDEFVHRLSRILTETATRCYAWALVPNHFHLLLKTGLVSIGRVMQKLLTGYAVYYNRRYCRSGHLFQNRFTSILCQEEPYLLELVRYIHLNPLRSGVVADMNALDRFAYCGHSVLMGTQENTWQNTKDILGRFSPDPDSARAGYRAFIAGGVSMGHRSDLTGGGLVRSSGGWEQVILQRRSRAVQKSDERMLGDHEFVSRVLEGANEHVERKFNLSAQGIDVASVVARVCEVLRCDRSDIFAPGKAKKRVHARSLFCYWAVRELGTSQVELSRQLTLSPAAITQSVKRGETLVKESGYSLL